MSETLTRQAERLYGVLSEFTRRYQFRDEDQICCYALSVSQCYALDALASRESMSMSDLAAHLCLKVSSVTRVVDQLVKSEFVRREEDPADRRVCRVRIASKGKTLVTKIRKALVAEYELVLSNVPQESREAVIEAISALSSAFEKRQFCVTEEAAGPGG